MGWFVIGLSTGWSLQGTREDGLEETAIQDSAKWVLSELEIQADFQICKLERNSSRPYHSIRPPAVMGDHTRLKHSDWLTIFVYAFLEELPFEGRSFLEGITREIEE